LDTFPRTLCRTTAIEAAGAVVTPISVAGFRAFVNRESSKYLNVIKETGVTSQERG